MISFSRRCCFTFLVACLCLPGIKTAVAETKQASWLGASEPSQANQWIAFRASVNVSQPNSSIAASDDPMIARIAADSKYWLWVDGELVVFEGGLKRGPSPTSTYVDHVDLGQWLEPGDHSIAVLLWHFGKEGFSHKNSGEAALLFDLPEAISVQWKARIHPAFGNTDAPHPNFRLPESNIRFDAAKDLTGWTQPNFDDSDWPDAVVKGGEGDQPWGDLVQRPIPQWKDFGIQAYVNEKDLALPRISDGELIKARLPYNAQVTPLLTVKSDAGKLIQIQTDHYRGGGPPNVRCEYLTRDGEQTYENLGWMNGHEVHYQIPAGVEIVSLGYRETGYACEPTGTFECDDEFLNKLRVKANRTLYVTMRDTYFDCPDRERAQWWGDAVLELGESFYAMDRRSDLLARKGILELMAWQRDDGTIFSPVPAGNYKDELPMQMLASVGRYGFWTYALHSGDLETIREVYPAVRRYLHVWKQGPDGLVIPRSGGWTWGDWGNHKDMNLLYNGWYYLALDGQRLMAQELGLTSEIRPIETKMARLKKAFNEKYWTGNQYRSPDYYGATDDRSQALAVVSGIAGPEKYDAIAEVLKVQRESSPYMEKYVMKALYRMDRPEQAIERCKQRYKPMVESEITTLWEGWGIGSAGYGGGTTNHAWSGGPLTIMSQFMAGVSPTSLGYKTFDVTPQPGPLKKIDCVIDSAAGQISVKIDRNDSGQSLRLTSPPETIAIVRIKRNEIAKIQANGKTVWPKPQSDADSESGIKLVSEDDQFVCFEVSAGVWFFESTR
ncbi:Bacterial alpha-L-rhamnosidase [Rubripirellula obstinata]|uniref:Bacterial alpha-L-rhamnosidase n=1 Tax=Rubripirellula obstinata TaxID=406547 RepID=A0A5B1CCH1_9BACT|nr:alpha-L-rhamnosidase C-terminal domain-containing protein [Rubripirellula obstinata]KAA1257912.1 Bacterial alpha-L-rhamnosidase [Rubripirellula obstinata]